MLQCPQSPKNSPQENQGQQEDRDAPPAVGNGPEDARINVERTKRRFTNVSIAAKATLPLLPSFPKRGLMLMISLVVGFFAALAIPFLLELLDHRIKTSEEIESFLGLPVICRFNETKVS